MNHSGKIMKAIVIGVSLFLGLPVTAKNAMSAIAPAVSNMTAVVDGASTPVRILADPSSNFYVSDPRGGGVLKYDRNGKLLKVFTAVPDAGGMAFSLGGELLVTHGTTAVRLDATTGVVLGSFGTFKKAQGIAVDAAGFVYISDAIDDCVQKFDQSYAPVTIATAAAGRPSNSFGTTGLLNGQFKRPSGITYEKASGQLAIADSLNGRISFFTTAGTWVSNLGSFGSGSAGTTLRFTMPKAIAFEYSGGVVSRYYVVDSFQSNVQVIDAATKTFLSYIGGYGYSLGSLVSPSDVEIDQTNPLTPVLIVASEIGLLSRYGIDSLQPTDVQVLKATIPDELTLTWTNPTVPTFSAVNIYQSTAPGLLGSLIGSNVTASTFTSKGLLAGATYYYTLRGVNTSAAETTNTDQYFGTTLLSSPLTVAQVGNGSGSVSSDLPLPGLTYSSGTYTAVVNSGTKVTLMPTHDANSTFAGWTGDVCNNQPSGNCVFTMGSAVNVTATFNLQHRFKIAGRAIYDDILQNIYNQAVDGETILAMGGVSQAYDANQYLSMTANNSTTITIIGGYDSEYKTMSGVTSIQGRVNLGGGKVIFNNIKIIP